MKPISIISQDLFDKVRSRFSNLEMGDETGAVIIDPEQARFFDFDFVFEGSNLGRVSISINDPGSLKVYFSQGITENQDDSAKKQWFNFLREMRFFAMRRLLRFDTRDIAKTNLDKNDFQHLAKTQAPKEEEMSKMNESKNKSRVLESVMSDIDIELRDIVSREDHDALYDLFTANTPAGKYIQNMYDDIVIDNRLHPDDDFEQIEELVWDRLENDFGGDYTDYSMRRGEMGMEEDMDAGQQGVTEGGMPSSVIKSKQKYAAMSDTEFYTAHKDKSEDDLRAMAWRHGYGKGSSHYVNKHKKGQQGVAETVDIGQEWMSDTELDQYVPDQLQQQWRELLGYDRDGNPSALWANLTGGYEPDVRDPEHRALMVKVANKWFAAKKIPNVKFFDVKDADDELEWLVQIGQQGVAEGLQEGRWNNKSSKKTSRAVAGKTEVIVRHARPVDEEYAGSRSQRKNIKAIYIQNADGERFKYPFIHTAGAFAMAQHVDHGGVPHDPAGQAIVSMSEEIAKLSEFQRKIHRATLHQDASGITERAIGRMNELKAQVAALGKRQHYQNWRESFDSDSMMDPSMEELDAVTMEEYKQKFTQTNFQEELSAYFPLLHKIMSEQNNIDLEEYVKESEDEFGEIFDIGMGQASHGKGHPDEEFAEWAEAVEQNKLTNDEITVLKQAIGELPQGKNGPELELGPEGSTAVEFFQGLGLDSSDLEEKLKDMANVDADADALEVFKIWANENYPELAVTLGISNTGTETPAVQQEPEISTEPEEPTAENDEMSMHKGAMTTRESVVKEVAKLVKSRYNKDNPEVGPFNGKENIALDVKKKCAEMFGDEVGEQAENLAMQFMEKLSSEWEAKHGPVQDDGLARLKELLGNVKAKVEGIGDITDNGHAPGNNIMPAEEGLGSKLLGGAALVAAMWGVNNHLANQAYEASPQLQKLTQFYKDAESRHDVAKMKELEQRIENHKTRLDLGHGDVMDKTGNPKEIVPEMADILKLSGLVK